MGPVWPRVLREAFCDLRAAQKPGCDQRGIVPRTIMRISLNSFEPLEEKVPHKGAKAQTTPQLYAPRGAFAGELTVRTKRLRQPSAWPCSYCPCVSCCSNHPCPRDSSCRASLSCRTNHLFLHWARTAVATTRVHRATSFRLFLLVTLRGLSYTCRKCKQQ
jgi:hypothetical protein